MAIWPFGRKGRPDAIEQDAKVPAHSFDGSRLDLDEPADLGHGVKRSKRRPSKKQQKKKKKSRTARPESQTGNSLQGMPYENTRAMTEKPPFSANTDPTDSRMGDSERDTYYGETPKPRGEIPSYYFLNPLSDTSLHSDHDGSLPVAPTLRAKRSANDTSVLPRAKSSKKNKRRNDPIREEEIRTMVSSTTVLPRPATYTGSGPPVTSGSKKRHSSLTRQFRRQTSDSSLPHPASLHSSDSANSERRSFRVRSLDVLSPRPTIRFSEVTRPHQGPSSWTPLRTESRRGESRRGHQPAIPEETLKQSNTIDELADDLDAAGLRELMERDERRKEKKRQSDQEKLTRRLQRRAEKQREEEQRERQSGLRNIDKGFLDRESMPPELTEADAEQQERILARYPKKANRSGSPVSWLKDPSVERLDQLRAADRQASVDNARSESPPSPNDQEEPVVATAQAIRLSQASMSPPTPLQEARPTSTISEVVDPQGEGAVATSDPTDSDPLASESSGRGGQRASWTAFFRRSGTRNKRASGERGRQTPSEFSNTSRDSLQRPPPLALKSASNRRSGPPMRTTSKFREDLPEYPISPPDSRLQSPEPRHSGILLPSPSERPELSLADKISAAAGSVRRSDSRSNSSIKRTDGTPGSRHRSLEAPSPEGGAPSTVVSQSMASIDSEGSWLSGGNSKRKSQNQPFPLRDSAGSLQKRYQEFSDSGEELGLAEDEYFSRLTPGPEQHASSQHRERARKSSSAGIASGASDDGVDPSPEESQRKWHGGVGRQPTVVHHTSRMKSREGLLNDFHGTGTERGSPELAGSPNGDGRSIDMTADETSTLQKATSVDMGDQQHVRHISAGSAKLLDIAPRSPTFNRLSGGSFNDIASV
ncbi:MAG: hypothetical protein M1825_003132 [Sarcosagium campestre]|nr:MAG: hypothetical protein M1825_003132 [Sarcosagium campestre]